MGDWATRKAHLNLKKPTGSLVRTRCSSAAGSLTCAGSSFLKLTHQPTFSKIRPLVIECHGRLIQIHMGNQRTGGAGRHDECGRGDQKQWHFHGFQSWG